MYGAQVMGTTRLVVIRENDGRSRSPYVNNNNANRQAYSDNSGSQCFKYILFYLFLTAVFVQVWVVVATSKNLPSIIITAILTFFAIVVLIWRHIVANRSYQEFRRRQMQQGAIQQERSTIMLRPLGLSMRNIPEQGPDHSLGLSQSLLMTLPTYTYTAMVVERSANIDGQNQGVSTYSMVGKDEETGLSREDHQSQSIITDSTDINASDTTRLFPRSMTCIVCLIDYTPGDELVLLPCGHEYHRTCVFTWLSCHRLCPVCKREVIMKPPTENPELHVASSTADTTTGIGAGTGTGATIVAPISASAQEQHVSSESVGINSTDLTQDSKENS